MATRGVNKVILVGNVGQDPEMRYMPSGGAVCNLSIATSESWNDKQTGEKKEQTEWHRVVLFGKLAEIAGEYVKKGTQLYIEGQLRTRKWTDQASGQERYATEIRVDQMQMLGKREGMGGPGDDEGYGGGYGAPRSAPAQRPAAPQRPPAAPAPAPVQAPHGGGFGDMDDDIPF